VSRRGWDSKILQLPLGGILGELLLETCGAASGRPLPHFDGTQEESQSLHAFAVVFAAQNRTCMNVSMCRFETPEFGVLSWLRPDAAISPVASRMDDVSD
jgi:hypothetical protein